MKAIVAGVVVLACGVVGLDAFAGPFFSLAVREFPTAVHGQRVLGGVEGPVKATDEDAQVIRVASGFLGLSSLTIVVTPETSIAVDGKVGWWGDLQRGLLVRVVYEVMPDERLVASRVELLDQGSAPYAAISSVSDGHAEPPVRPRVMPVGTEPAAPPVHRPHGADQPDAIAPGPAGTSPKTSAALPPAPPRPAVRVSTTTPPTAVSRPAPATPSPARPSGTSGSQGEDGGAAVEWLLKESPAGR